MSINREEVMLRPEQLTALDNMKRYGVPEELIARTKKDFEDANFELMGTTSRRRAGSPVVRKIDIVPYVVSSLPTKSDRQDLAKSLELIVAFSIVINAEVVDKAKELIELDELKSYDVMDCIRGIYAVVDKDRGWGDRDTKGKITALIETLKPDEVEFEVEDETTEPEVTGEELPLVEDEKPNQEVEKKNDVEVEATTTEAEAQPVATGDVDPETTTTRTRKRTAA